MCFAAAKLMPSGQPQQGASMSGGPHLTWGLPAGTTTPPLTFQCCPAALQKAGRTCHKLTPSPLSHLE